MTNFLMPSGGESVTFDVPPILRGVPYQFNLPFLPQVAEAMAGWESARIRVQFRRGAGKPILAAIDTASAAESASLSAIDDGPYAGGVMLEIRLSGEQTDAMTISQVEFDVLLSIGGADRHLPGRWIWPVADAITVPT